MLPSMPLLMTPVKELHDDSSDASEDSFPHRTADTEDAQQVNASKPSVTPEVTEPLLLSTSGSSCDAGTQGDDRKGTDKTHTPEKRSSSEPLSAQKKKKKTHQLKTIAALTPDSGVSLENSAQNFAEAYFLKVKSHLDDEKWSQFLQELVDFEARLEKQPVDLYRRMKQLLSPYPELLEEFLAFLLPEQALEVNQFIPYLLLCKMKEFLRKLNILLMKRQVRQVLSALEALAVQPNVTLAEVKSSVLPLLKSSPLLTSQFLELLPGERTPDSLMTEFEKVDLKDDSLFETLVVPDCPDPYGSEKCICSCHSGQKTRHCVRCGIKYLNGRVYLQYGKVLRPAKVTFKGNKHIDLTKWEDKCGSRRRFHPKTMLSPSCIDHRLNADSEDDCGVKKSPRTPKIRAARTKVTKKVAVNENKEEVLDGIFPLAESKNTTVASKMMEELVVDCKMNPDGNEEHEFDEVVLEGECNTEEDEEEDKCVHSENESSLEAEDIGKDLESGIDFSFEDEEMEDIEGTDLTQNEMSKSKSNYHFQDFRNEELLISVPTKNFELGDNEIYNENNVTSTVIKYDVQTDQINPTVKEEPCSTNKMGTSEDPEGHCSSGKDRKISENKFSKINTINSNLCTSSDTTSELKKEDLSDTEKTCETGNSVLLDEDPKGKQGAGDQIISDLQSSSKEWTREEDKIILQTIQSENGLEQAFETSKLQLPNRSKEEIQTRFDFVLKLLKEMISDESST